MPNCSSKDSLIFLLPTYSAALLLSKVTGITSSSHPKCPCKHWLSSLIPTYCIVRVQSSFVSSKKVLCTIFLTSRNAFVSSVTFLNFELIRGLHVSFQHFVHKVVHRLVCAAVLSSHLLLQIVQELKHTEIDLGQILCHVLHSKVGTWNWQITSLVFLIQDSRLAKAKSYQSTLHFLQLTCNPITTVALCYS